MKLENKTENYEYSITFNTKKDLIQMCNDILKFIGEKKPKPIEKPNIIILDEPDEETDDEETEIDDEEDEESEIEIDDEEDDEEHKTFSIENQEHFLTLLTDVGITEKSLKNYKNLWNNDIWGSVGNGNILVEIFKKQTEDCKEQSKINSLYNLYNTFFKLNDKFKWIRDPHLTTIINLFNPIRTKRQSIPKKKNIEKTQQITPTEWEEIKNKSWEMCNDINDPWVKICWLSYFEIECLRNDFYNSIVVENEIKDQVNQYILSTQKFKIVVGKTMGGKDPIYYDISPRLMDLLKNVSNTEKSPSKWEYHIRKIFKKYKNDFNQGVINYLRIAKKAWIEKLNIPITEKEEMCTKMLHSYNTSEEWYS